MRKRKEILPNRHKLAKPDTSQPIKNTAISTVCELITGDELLIRSLDFALIEALQANEEWARAGAILNAKAKALEWGGADLLLLAANTMEDDRLQVSKQAEFAARSTRAAIPA